MALAWPLPRAALAIAALAGVLAPTTPTRAQPELVPIIPTGPPPSTPSVIEAPPPPDLPPRPRLSVAVGMGATFDATGFPDGAHAIPAFFGTGGFGDGLLGFELGAFSSEASGRFTQVGYAPIDRLALDAFAVIRPAARVRADDLRYRYRVLHTLAAEVGVGVERDGRTNAAGSRFQIHTGARVELPLTPAGRASELRLRLAFRRAVGLYTPQIGSGGGPVTFVGDSNELFAALAVVF